MKILAVEFSSAHRSVAVVERRGSAWLAAEAVETGSPDTPALAMVERALAEAGLEREQIECVVVGVGPGSYHGIRAAISLAQGWEIARPVKLLAVSSADTIAAQAADEGLAGEAAVVIDAQRNEFYVARYELGEPAPRALQPLRLVTRAELPAAVPAGSLILGPEVTKWFPAGRTLFPTAAALGRLAATRTDFLPPEKLEPIYLRATTFVKVGKTGAKI